MNYHDISAEYSPEQSGYNMLEDIWSISNSSESEELAETEYGEDVDSEIKVEGTKETSLYSDLRMNVIYHCSICRMCTDNHHTIGCPYYCFDPLLKHYKKSEKN